MWKEHVHGALGTMAEMGVYVCLCVIARACTHIHKRIVGKKLTKLGWGHI